MPRDLKTEPQTDDVADTLSVEEEKLVELLSAGKGNAEAYRLAYGADGYSPNALAVRASRKIAEPKIQYHLRKLRSVGLANLSLSFEDRIRDEMAFAQRAENEGNFGAAGQARDRINKLAGLYVEKVQDVTGVDPVQTLKDIAQHQPDLAASLAAAHGIPWKADEGATKH